MLGSPAHFLLLGMLTCAYCFYWRCFGFFFFICIFLMNLLCANLPGAGLGLETCNRNHPVVNEHCVWGCNHASGWWQSANKIAFCREKNSVVITSKYLGEVYFTVFVSTCFQAHRTAAGYWRYRIKEVILWCWM